MRKPIIFLLLLILCLPPFFGGGYSQIAVNLFLIAGGFLLLLFYARKTEQKEKFHSRSVFLFWLLFLLTAGIGLSKSISPFVSLNYYFLFLGYFVLFSVSALLKITNKELKIISKIILICASVLCLIGIWQYLNGEYARLMSTFYWPNPFAGYLLFFMPLSLGLFLIAKEKTDSWFYGTVLILLASSFILTESRASFISIIPSLLILLWLLANNADKKSFFFKLSLVFICVILTTTIIFSAKLQKPSLFFLSRSQVGATENFDISVLHRFEYWNGALQIFGDYPFWGSGLNTFQIIYPLYQKFALGFSRYVHNFYLQLLSEGGIPVFLFFLLILFALCRTGIKLLKKAKKDGKDFYASFLFLGMLGSALHNGADFDWYFPANFITFWVLAGIISGVYSAKKSYTEDKNYKIIIFNILAIILCSKGFVGLLSEQHFEKAAIAAENRLINLAIQEYRKGLALYPEPYYREKFGILLYFAALWEPTKTKKEIFLKNSEESATKSLRANPLESSHYYLLGKINLANNKTDYAELYFRKAIDLDPLNHLQYYLDLAKLYLTTNNPEGAGKTIDSALEKFQNETTKYLLEERNKELIYRLQTPQNPIKTEFLDKLNELNYLKETLNP